MQEKLSTTAVNITEEIPVVYFGNLTYGTHVPDLVDNIHPRLLQKDFGDKALGHDNLGRAGLHQLWTNIATRHHMWTQGLCCVHHGLQQRLEGVKKRGGVDKSQIYIYFNLLLFITFQCLGGSHSSVFLLFLLTTP